MNKRGFTLIELLIVIAIIAILAAILFPVFTKAREKARQTQCSNNQRQIAIAAMLYTQEHNETLPKAAEFWSSLKLTSALADTSLALQSATTSKVVSCPDSNKVNGYIYNNNLSGKSLGEMLAAGKDFTSMFLTADGNTANNIGIMMDDLEYRHDGKLIASFLDGHVEPRDNSTSTTKGTMNFLETTFPAPGDTISAAPGVQMNVNSGTGMDLTWTVQKDTTPPTPIGPADVLFDSSTVGSNKDFTFVNMGSYLVTATTGSGNSSSYHVICAILFKNSIFNPGAFTSLGPCSPASGTITFDTTALTVSGAITGTGVDQANASGNVHVAVFTFDSVNIPAGVTVVATGSRPLVIASKTDITIGTTISVNGANSSTSGTPLGGPGGGSGGLQSTGSNGSGTGGSAGVNRDKYGTSGASYGGIGGKDAGRYNSGGATYGDAALDELYGGSGGGGANDYTGAGGGGAIELTAVGNITITGSITANGGRAAGVATRKSGGAGSGGAVLISGATVNISGTVTALGGVGQITTLPLSLPSDVNFQKQYCAGGGGGGRIAIYGVGAPLNPAVVCFGGVSGEDMVGVGTAPNCLLPADGSRPFYPDPNCLTMGLSGTYTSGAAVTF